MINEQVIITKLAEKLSVVTNIKQVYEGIPPYNAVFPCVTIRPLEFNEEWGDLRDTIENETFIITAYIQLDNTRLDSQSKLIAIVKNIREILGDQDNIDLDNEIDSIRLNSGNYMFLAKESNLYACEIRYNVRKRFNRF
jgi:hypothetical protein